MSDNQKKTTSPIPPKYIWWVYIVLALSFLGILDAGYLTFYHYTGDFLPCAETGDCEKVLTSKYATLFELPVALYGVIFYLIVFVFSIVMIDRGRLILISFVFYLSTLAFLVSTTFVYVQLFKLEAICWYCMASAILSTAIFVISGFLRTKFNNKIT